MRTVRQEAQRGTFMVSAEIVIMIRLAYLIAYKHLSTVAPRAEQWGIPHDVTAAVLAAGAGVLGVFLFMRRWWLYALGTLPLLLYVLITALVVYANPRGEPALLMYVLLIVAHYHIAYFAGVCSHD